MRPTTTLVLGTVSLAAATAAAGDPIASFTFSDLLGSYDTNTNMYTAVAGSLTAGDVTRVAGPGGTAQYDTGFLGGSTQANYLLDLLVSGISGGTANGNGSLTITDDNGDTITADINGTFRVFGGSVAYEGILDQVLFNDDSGDGTFDGPSAGGFSTSFASPPPYDGSVINLFFDPGSFFGTGFSNELTLSSGLIIPTPASTGALTALALIAGHRRRR